MSCLLTIRTQSFETIHCSSQHHARNSSHDNVLIDVHVVDVGSSDDTLLFHLDQCEDQSSDGDYKTEEQKDETDESEFRHVDFYSPFTKTFVSGVKRERNVIVGGQYGTCTFFSNRHI